MFMFEKAVAGSRRYWLWIGALAVVLGIGFACYLLQLQNGLMITGLSRDVTWGLYIAQFTFLVGVAASAVMVVLLSTSTWLAVPVPKNTFVTP